MFRAAVHISLVFALLACPVWCQLGVCSEDHGVGARAGVECDTCDHCPGEAPAGSTSDDRKPCEQSCQCLCAGAVIQKDEVRWDSKFDQPIDALALRWTTATSSLNRDDRRNVTAVNHTVSGRMIRCLHMSFLL